jgi:hypothetical protein
VGDTVVVGALNGAVLVADARTGVRRLNVPLGDTLMFATPAFDGEWAIAGTMSGRLVGVHLGAGD